MRLKPLAAVLSAAALSVCLPGVPARADTPQVVGAEKASDITEAPTEYKLPDGTTAKGFVAMPAGASDAPAVLVIPEWWGLTEYPKTRARELARHGYVALVADMYGDGKTADTPDAAKSLAGKSNGTGLAKLAAPALQQLKSMKQVDGGKVAAIGFCFGGSTVADMVKSGADLQAAVSFHGGLGPDAAPAKGATIKTPFLVCHGGADPMVPPGQFAQFVQKSIEAGVPLTVVSFPGAVHAFTNPAADEKGMDGVKYDKEAAERSMAIMYQFFAMTIGDPLAEPVAGAPAAIDPAFSVVGAVPQPGKFLIGRPGDPVSVADALQLAGKPADENASVFIVQGDDFTAAEAHTYKEVVSGRDPIGGAAIRVGDTIFVQPDLPDAGR